MVFGEMLLCSNAEAASYSSLMRFSRTQNVAVKQQKDL